MNIDNIDFTDEDTVYNILSRIKAADPRFSQPSGVPSPSTVSVGLSKGQEKAKTVVKQTPVKQTPKNKARIIAQNPLGYETLLGKGSSKTVLGDGTPEEEPPEPKAKKAPVGSQNLPLFYSQRSQLAAHMRNRGFSLYYNNQGKRQKKTIVMMRKELSAF